MPTETFTWVPSTAYSLESKPEVSTIKFGNGYSQRVARGFHTRPDSWKLQFINQTLVLANQIISFFEARGGIEYFYFTPNGESTQYRVVCQEWTEEYVAHFSKTITATFKIVYDKV